MKANLQRRVLFLVVALAAASAAARANTLFIADNVITGRTWNAPTNPGTAFTSSCSLTAGAVNYFSAPFFTDQSADTYELHLYYPSFQSGFVYIYADSFNPQDPCTGIAVFGNAPLANIYNIHLDAWRQYFFVTSEDALFGGGGAFQVCITGPAGNTLMEGIAPPSGTVAYCFGDGSGAACPCGNNGAANSGCANSVNASGASLAAIGQASISADTLTFLGSGMPNGTALYFQGNQALSGGLACGGGLRCVGGTIVRLGTILNSSGSSVCPGRSGTPISITGAARAGDYCFYQCWYRDPASHCTSTGFNLTNALRVTWTP